MSQVRILFQTKENTKFQKKIPKWRDDREFFLMSFDVGKLIIISDNGNDRDGPRRRVALTLMPGFMKTRALFDSRKTSGCGRRRRRRRRRLLSDDASDAIDAE